MIVKLDFINAFNSVRRDVVLDAAAQNTPELYRFVHAACSCEHILAFGEHQILSTDDFQQGDRLSALEFCEAVQPLLSRCESEVEIGFMDDFTLSGQLDTVASDVEMIAKSAKDIGLVFNPTKCEIICFDDKSVDMEVFKDYTRVRSEDMTLLGAPILKGPAIDKTPSIKVDDLTRVVSRLTQLQAHDGLTLLRNCFSMPTLLDILRTSPCSGNHLLEKFDMVLREGLAISLT